MKNKSWWTFSSTVPAVSNRMASSSFVWSTTFASTTRDWTRRWRTMLPNREVTCIGRIWTAKDVLDGWKVRMIDGRDKRYQGHRRYRMIKRVFEMTLTDGARLISQEDILFGRGRRSWVFRTSVGCGLTDDTYGATMVYDAAMDRWLYWPSFHSMRSNDEPFNRYYQRQPDPSEFYLFPTYLSDRQCFTSARNGYVYQIQFTPPTLKFSAANSLFRSDPGLRWRITADEFEKTTGIGGMKAHFDGD